jgi:hypothetical protein
VKPRSTEGGIRNPRQIGRPGSRQHNQVMDGPIVRHLASRLGPDLDHHYQHPHRADRARSARFRLALAGSNATGTGRSNRDEQSAGSRPASCPRHPRSRPQGLPVVAARPG